MLKRVSSLPLPWQTLLMGGACAAPVVLAGTTLGMWPGVVGGAWTVAATAAALGGACWPARRAAVSARELAESARALCAAEGTLVDSVSQAQVPVGCVSQAPAPAPAGGAQQRGVSPELTEAAHQLHCLMAQTLRQRQQLDSRVAALGRQLDTHAQALSTLQDLSIGLARSGGLNELVPEALRLLEQNMAYASASVWGHADLDPAKPVVLLGCRSQADEMAGPLAAELIGQPLSRANLQHYEQIERSGTTIVENRLRPSLLSWLRTLVSDDSRSAALYRGTRAWIAVPLKVNDRVLGVLRVDHGEADYFDAERIRLLDAVASQTALALSHAQALARERDSAVATERNRIARDLHDAVSQTLFAANLLAGTMARTESLAPDDRLRAQTLESLNRSALAEMRMMLFELRPDALEGVRLAELLQHATQALSGRGTVQVRTDVATEPALPSPLRIEVYRIAQEALSNIARHSGAHHAHVSWQVQGPTHGVLRIADDGRGFDPGAPYPGHFGLENMRQRALKLGAALHIRSAPGEGSELVLDLHWST